MSIARLRSFVADLTRLVEREGDEGRLLPEASALMARLVAADDWLPEAFAQPHPEHYQQYLLHCDPQERFSVVSFVWGPGQRTPVHDHTVWGVIGMLRGEETCRLWAADAAGRLAPGAEQRLRPGDTTAVSPRIGDVHDVANGLADRVSISIHAYGANIGAVRRHVFAAETGAPKDFVSGYANSVLPNLWDRSAEVRATLGR